MYVSMFKPLGIAVAVALTVVFLGESLFLGRYHMLCFNSILFEFGGAWLKIEMFECSVIGSIIILVGFYTVIWGQANENNMLENEVCGLESSHQKTPLIHNT